ncbi:MAG: hypothetical protein IT366_09110 [Candidatus Hydrogenedentes bacterium]|nr:hypothetical protein [Candidatus Hydrogenedentota bacterium]
MSLSPTLRIPFQRKRQRWPFVLATLAVLLVVGWQITKRIIDADRYRPYLVERITKNTGLPATVERMDFVLFPTPALRAKNVSVGQGDFHASCTYLSAYPHIPSLLKGTINVSELQIENLAATLPTKPGDLRDRVLGMVQAHRDHVASGEQGGSGIKLAIGRIEAPDATIRLEGVEKPVFAGNLAATNVLSPTITIIADAASPLYGPETNLDGTITLERDAPEEIGLGVHGELNLTNVDTASLFSAQRVPRAVATVNAKIERTGASQFKVALDGNANPLPMEGVDLTPIAGSFNGVAWWDAGQITINGLNWNAPGLQFASDITIEPNAAVAARVTTLTANRDGLQAFLAAQPSEDYRVTASESAAVQASNLLIGLTAEKKLRLAEGTGTFKGVDLTLPKGERAITGFTGEIAFENDAINIVSLKAEDLSLKGTVHPKLGEGKTAIDLQGTIKLSRERLGMFMPIESVKSASGTIALDHVKGTFGSKAGVPDDLSIQGKIADGAFAIDSPSWSDSFTNVKADFTATPGTIETAASASTQKLGSVNASGKYVIAKRTWNGTVRGNLAKMDLPFLKQEAAKKVAPGILAGYGDSQFTIALQLPEEKKPRLQIDFDRKDTPDLDGTVVMLNKKEGWELGDVTVDATIPGDALQPMLPENVRVGGQMPVHFVRDAAKGVFDAKIDLRQNDLALSEYLTKRSGTVAGLDIQGVAMSGNWAAKQVKIVCLDQTINGQFTEQRFEIPNFDISAGALAALMPEGTKAGGRIRGSAATQPVQTNLMLDNVNFALNDELGIDNLNGAISYADEGFTCKDLSVRGADSDFTLDLVKRGDNWSGALTGNRLNVDSVLATQRALQSTSFVSANEPAAESKSSSTFSGKFDINMENVLYRRAQLSKVFTNVTAINGDVEIGNLVFSTTDGGGAGWVRLAQPRGDRPASTSMSLKLDGVDLALIDDIALEDPRGIRGHAFGQFDLELFTGENIPPFTNANGSVQVRATDGTFGKLGMATKVLSVLRTLEITRLRAPKLKDQGLSFDTCESQATFKDGVMTLQTFNMATPSYNITAIGTIDFNAQNTDVLVHVDVLETVLGAADLVPGLDAIVGQLRNAGGLRILLTGPPTDPDVKYGYGPKASTITREVRDGVKSTGNIVRDEVINKATEVLKGILNKN